MNEKNRNRQVMLQMKIFLKDRLSDIELIPIIEQEMRMLNFDTRSEILNYVINKMLELKDRLNTDEKRNFYAFFEFMELLSLMAIQKEKELFPFEIQ